MGRDRSSGGLFGLLGSGVGMAAEYREHRKQQKVSREKHQRDLDAKVDPSSKAQLAVRAHSTHPPPAYEEDAKSSQHFSRLAVSSVDEKSTIPSQHNDGDGKLIEGDEEHWQLDEATDRGDTEDPVIGETFSSDSLVRGVMKTSAEPHSGTVSFKRKPLPCPVIIPQRRPRKKARGFVRAYAPLLGECCGIDQETFLAFLENFFKSSQASPVFPMIQLASGVAGMFAPGFTAMVVTTAVQIAAEVGEEADMRRKTNNFLEKINNELFKPAGLYAMVVKYKTDAEAQQSGNSAFAKFGVMGQAVDMDTNQTIAKYDQSGGMMDKFRAASSSTEGSINLPAAAPLVFPALDNAVAREGPEAFKDKMKDAKGFLSDYMDKKAQIKYAQDDPQSRLALPEEQLRFRSKLADSNHPMYGNGLVGLISGGALARGDKSGNNGRSRDRSRSRDRNRSRDRSRSRDRRRSKDRSRRQDGSGDDRRSDGRKQRQGLGGGVFSLAESAASGNFNRSNVPPEPQHYGESGRSSDYDPYGGQNKYYEGHSYGERFRGDGNAQLERRSFDDRGGMSFEHGKEQDYQVGADGRATYVSGSDTRRKEPGDAGLRGMARKVSGQNVMYLMIVNMPSEAELAEARAKLAMVQNA